MKKFSQRSAALWLVLLVLSLFVLACNVGSLISLGGSTSPEPTGQALAQPTTATGSTSTTPVPPAKDAQSRISDSLNRILLMDQKVLDSYHLEVSGTEPKYNKDTKKVESQPFTFKADIAGDDVHFTSTSQSAKPSTTEGYIMDLNSKDQTKGYAVDSGKVKEDLFMPLTWAMLPLEWGMPLIYASMGPTAAGSETIDGRAADKFNVDIANAPAGAAGVLKGIGFNVYASKGTVWVDKQTSGLLKMSIDYDMDVQDAGKAVGRGTGRIELAVTQVGKVAVKLPDGSASGPSAPATGPATSVASGAKTPTRTPTAAPTASVAKVGQRVVLQGIALTVTKVDKLDTYGGRKADAGNSWVIATVTVENTSNAKVTVEQEQFDYVDVDGAAVSGMLNGPSAPGNTGATVMAYSTLNPGGKVANKTLPIQMDKGLLKGLTLEYTIDDEHTIAVDLGLQ